MSSAVSLFLIVVITWLVYEFIRPGVDPQETWPLLRLILQGVYVLLIVAVFEGLRPWVNRPPAPAERR